MPLEAIKAALEREGLRTRLWEPKDHPDKGAIIVVGKTKFLGRAGPIRVEYQLLPYHEGGKKKFEIVTPWYGNNVGIVRDGESEMVSPLRDFPEAVDEVTKIIVNGKFSREELRKG